MLCPNCGYTESHILRTARPSPEVTRRRRECDRCKTRFSTLEVGVTTHAPIEEILVVRRFHVRQLLVIAEDLAEAIRELLKS